MDAIKHQYPIQISITNRHGKRITTRTIPEYLEYSEKDDKFRLIGTGSKLGNTINLGRITSCEKCENQQGGKVLCLTSGTGVPMDLGPRYASAYVVFGVDKRRTAGRINQSSKSIAGIKDELTRSKVD